MLKIYAIGTYLIVGALSCGSSSINPAGASLQEGTESSNLNPVTSVENFLPEGLPGGKQAPLTPIKTTKPVSSGGVPAGFQPNMGQAASQVDFIGKSKGYNLYISGSEVYFDLINNAQFVSVNLVGASPVLLGRGEEQQPGITNFLMGESKDWVLNVPTYAKVHYDSVYPKIGLIFYPGPEGSVEHDFIVAPGGNYKDIMMDVKGGQSLSLTSEGDIDVSLPDGSHLTMKKPVAYQQSGFGNRTNIPVQYDLSKGGNLVAFKIDESAYDRNLDLIIDPVTMNFSRYLGGSLDDVIIGMDVDINENVLVCGYTRSNTNFPAAGSPQQGSFGGGNFDAFVSKIDSNGNLVTVTYLGGGGNEVATSVKVDSVGNVYLSGYTTSSNFPTFGTYNPSTRFGSTLHGGVGFDGFFMKLSASLKFDGSYAPFSVYYGGTGFDSSMQIALDTTTTGCGTTGYPCINMIGTTTSTGLAGSDTNYQFLNLNTNTTNSDAYLARFAQLPSLISIHTYYGTEGNETGVAIAVDGNNPAVMYVAGTTDNPNSQLLGKNHANAPGVQSSYRGDRRDGWVAKFNFDFRPANSRFAATFLGSSGDDTISGIAVHPKTGTPSVYVMGTSTANFFEGSIEGNPFSGNKDMFIAKLNSTMNDFTYLTFIGGSGMDDAPGIQSLAVDSIGRAWFGGRTTSADLSTTGAISQIGQSTFVAGSVGLFGRIDAMDSATTYSVLSYHGPSSGAEAADTVGAVAVNPETDASGYFAGYASEAGFPSNIGPGHAGAKDAFITQVSMPSNGCPADTDSFPNCVRGYQVKGLEILVMESDPSEIGFTPTQTMPLPTPASGGTYQIAGIGAFANDNVRLFFTGFYPSPRTEYPIGMNPTGVTASAAPTGVGVEDEIKVYSIIFRLNGAAVSQAPGNCVSSPGDYTICVGQPSAAGPNVTATARVPQGFTLIAGGAYDDHVNNGGSKGHYIYASYPSAILANEGGVDEGVWTVSGKDNPAQPPLPYVAINARVTAYAIGVRTAWLAENGLSVELITSNSVQAQNNLVQTATTTGSKVLIGGGARVFTPSDNGHWLMHNYPISKTQWSANSHDAWDEDLVAGLRAYAIGIGPL
jgi:hypothetical protein